MKINLLYPQRQQLKNKLVLIILITSLLSYSQVFSQVDAGLPQVLCTNNTQLDGSDPGTGSGIWTVRSGSGTFVNPTYYRTQVISVGRGDNIYRWTVTNVENIHFAEVQISNYAVIANAGADTIICANFTNLNADDPIIGTGLWTTLTPGVIFANTADPKTAVSNLPPGGTTFRWTVTSNGCSSWDDVVISNNDFFTSAGVPQVLCTDNTMLDAINPGTGSGIWTVMSGSGIFVNPAYYRTQVNSVGRGDNIYRWTVTNGYCSDYAEVRVSNYSVIANAGLDNYTCDGTYQLQGNNPVNQNITIPNLPGTGTWSTVGPSIIENSYLFNSMVNNLNPDINLFTWTITNGICTSVDEVLISNDRPTNPNAGPDATFCGVDFAPQGYNSIYNSLTGNAPNYARGGVGETGNWSQVAGSGTFLDPPSTPNLRVDNLEYYAQLVGPDYWNLNPTVNTFRWTISYKLCELYDEVSITNAAPFPAYAGPDQTVCWDNANLNAVDLGSGAQLYWWEATPPAGITFYHPLKGNEDNTPFNVHVEGLQIATSNFTWYKRNTINGLTCTIWDETSVTRVAANVGATTAGSNQVVCSREAMMQGSPAGEAFTPPPAYYVTGMWSVISGGAIFDSPSLYNTMAYDLGYDTNILRWTITNHDLGCIATDDVYITNAMPSEANAGPDQTVCSSETLLSAERPTRGTGTWSVIGGGGTISNTNCENFNCNTYVTNMGTGLNTFLWTVSNAYTNPATGFTHHCELTDQINVRNNQIIADAGLDITTCTDDAMLAATAPGVGQYGLWEVVGGSGVVTNPTRYNSTVTGLSPNANTLRWTLNNAYCSNSDFMTISNNNPTDPLASTPNPNTCDGNAIIYGNNPVYGTGIWSVFSGGSVIANPTLASTTVSNMSIGPNTYRWTITKNGCFEFADVVVTNRAVVANAGLDIDNICGIEPAISSVTLNATPPNLALGQTGTWSVVNSSGTIINPSLFYTQVSGMDNGTNTFRWTLSNGYCTSFDDVSVIVYIPSTANAGADYETCASMTDSRPLTGNNPAPGRGIGTWNLISGGGTITNPNSAVTSVTNLAPDLNVFRWRINHNGCISEDFVNITNNYVTANAGPDDLICVDTYTLAANDPLTFYNGNTYPTGQWTLQQGVGIFAQPSLYNSTVSGVSAAITNIYRWTIHKGICSAFDEVQIVNNRFSIDAGVNQTLCDDFAFLDAQQPGTGTGTWSLFSGGGTFVNTTLYNTRVNGLSSNPNIFRWTVTRNGCTAFDEVTVYNNRVVANAGFQQRVCDNFATLNGNQPAPTGATGNWASVIGGTTITAPTLYNSGVTNLAIGQNTLQWTISRTLNGVSCQNSSQVNIFNDKPSDALVEADKEVCSNSTQLSVLTIPTIGSGIWISIDNPANFDNPANLNTSVTGLNYGTNTFRWTVTNYGCSSYDEIIITNKQEQANAGPDALVVDNTEYTLQGNIPASGSGLWTSSAPEVVFNNPSLANAIASDIPHGTTTFTWTLTNQCGSNSDEVILNRVFSVFITSQPQSLEINKGTTATFTVEASGDISGYQWRKNGLNLEASERISGVHTKTLSISNSLDSDEGNYDCIITGPANSLISEVAVLSVVTGMEELALEGIRIYPNPSNGQLELSFETIMENTRLEIFDLNGKKLKEKAIQHKNEKISLLEFEDGIYFLYIRKENKIFKEKIILIK